MVKNLNSRSRTTEISGTATRIVNAYENAGLTDSDFLTGIINRLKAQTNRMIVAIHRSQTRSKLDEKDTTRDDKFRSLFNFIQGNVEHPVPTIKSAAKILYDIISSYGLEIIKKSYVEETALMKSFLNDLQTDEAQTAIAAFAGVEILVTELTTAEQDFEDTRTTYEAQVAQDKNKETASEIRYEVLQTINEELLVYLPAKVLEDKTTYNDFALTVAQVIADNNQVVKERLNKKQTTGEEEIDRPIELTEPLQEN